MFPVVSSASRIPAYSKLFFPQMKIVKIGYNSGKWANSGNSDAFLWSRCN